MLDTLYYHTIFFLHLHSSGSFHHIIWIISKSLKKWLKKPLSTSSLLLKIFSFYFSPIFHWKDLFCSLYVFTRFSCTGSESPFPLAFDRSSESHDKSLKFLYPVILYLQFMIRCNFIGRVFRSLLLSLGNPSNFIFWI